MGVEGVVRNGDLCIDCGECVEVCFAQACELVGSEMTVSEVMAEIEKDIPFSTNPEGALLFLVESLCFSPIFYLHSCGLVKIKRFILY